MLNPPFDCIRWHTPRGLSPFVRLYRISKDETLVTTIVPPFRLQRVLLLQAPDSRQKELSQLSWSYKYYRRRSSGGPLIGRCPLTPVVRVSL